MPTLELVVDDAGAGARLDAYLAGRLAASGGEHALSRAGIQRLIEEGRVTVNGRSAKPSIRLRLDDLLRVDKPAPRDYALSAEDLPLDVLYEDSDCLVINKAPGMVVHPAAGCASGTVVNALLHYCTDLAGIGGERRPGIVHRLDRDTSGAMIVAKNSFAFERLARQFKRRSVEKQYLALVWGDVGAANGVIDRPIGRHRSDRKRMSSLRTIGATRAAVTAWQAQRRFTLGDHSGAVTWLRVRPQTGRTHQIRVHLADIGHPVVGDKVYGSRNRRLHIRIFDDVHRQMLHAETLAVDHPRTGVRLIVEAPLPRDMRQILEALDRMQEAGLGVDKKRAFT